MRSCQTLILLTCVFSLTGCMKVGPKFSGPKVSAKTSWIDKDDERLGSSKAHLKEWWTGFQDPTLDNLIDLAYHQNLSLKIAGFRIQEARALLGVAVGFQFPQTQQLQGSSLYKQISKNSANTNAGIDLTYWSHNLGLNMAWELDFWGRYRSLVDSAKTDLLASEANYDDVLVILLSDVARIYVSIRTFQERIEIVKQNIQVQKRGLEIATARFEAGMVTELDVKQAESLLYDTEARIPRLEINLRQAENALSVLLGMPADDLTDLLSESNKIPVAPENVEVGIPTCLLLQRPDTRRAFYETLSQNARVGVATTDLYPQISLTGFFGFETSSGTDNTRTGRNGSLFSGSSFTQTVGPGFIWPILNYGRITNNINAEMARLKQLIINYQNTVLVAYQEVEDGIVEFLKSQDESEKLSKSSEAAARSVQLANTQYVEGSVDYTRVLNTQQSLLLEEEKYAIARGSIALGLINTYKALGGGWQIRCD